MPQIVPKHLHSFQQKNYQKKNWSLSLAHNGTQNKMKLDSNSYQTMKKNQLKTSQNAQCYQTWQESLMQLES